MAAYYTGIIRKDVLDQLNLSMPKTFDDFTAMLKAMKKAYPDSYPWISRQKIGMIVNYFAPGLGISCAPQGCSSTGYAVWNSNSKKFTSLMDEKNFRWFMEWMNGLYKEGLIDPDMLSNDSATWSEKLVTGKGFFSVDYFARAESMTSLGVANNKDFLMSSMLCPANSDGTQGIFANIGVLMSNALNAKCENADRLIDFIDKWYYSEEGSLMSTYGVEGETYTKNAKNQLSLTLTKDYPDALSFNDYFGTSTLCLYGTTPDLFGYDLLSDSSTEIFKTSWNTYKDHLIDLPPTIFTSDDENKEISDECPDLNGTTIPSILTEFVIGRRDPNSDTDWKAAIAEMESAGLSDYLSILNKAYTRQNS
jgi:putative aldouronate transport system substrate-binding protein